MALLAALGCCCCGGAGAPDRARSGKSPHVLLVTLDTTRADHMGAYGHEAARTPAFDGLASEGVLYERAWAPAPLTTPAHASLFTGLYPGGHGVRSNGRLSLRGEMVTLAERLQDADYATGAFVAAFPVTRPFGLAQGFDHFDDDFGVDQHGRPRSARRADEVNARALPWIRARLAGAAGPPLFVWVHYYDPHTPYEPPEAFRATFDGTPYDAEIAFVDTQLARLLEVYREAGVLDNTVVAVAGDHGEGLDDHGEYFHGLLVYEAMLRVPLVLRAPGLPRGERRQELVSLVDLCPTLIALAGLPVPDGLHGVDVSRATESDTDPDLRIMRRGRDRVVYAESFYGHDKFGWAPLYAARQADEKWIDAPRPERYDLAADPAEETNLAGREPERDRALARVLSRLRAATQGPADAAEVRPVDAATHERLESLGYVGADAGVDVAEAGRRDPKDALEDYHRYDFAVSLVRAGRGVRAVSLLQELVAGDPDNPEFRMRLAEAYEATGDALSAERCYRETLTKHPAFFLGNLRLSALLEAQGRAAESRNLWLALLERRPGFVGAETGLARAYLANGQPGEALAVAERSLRERGESAEMHRMAARALAAQGRNDEALACLRRALELRPSNKWALDAAVSLLHSQGREAEARALVEEILVRAGEDPSAPGPR